ncbi:Chain_A [Hexamita inflata]|uniref:Leucine Rich Repeat Protein n=1 Tax=Hexamita inflata TaxID=28002 RepID=A0AA86NI96_9EUKA|nr:Chain A [Hexamita inflata]
MQDLNLSGNMHIIKPSYSSIILPNLRKINLRWNIIGDISVIHSFSSVIELNLSCNNLKQLLQPRSDLNNLIHLDLNGNGLQDISTLRFAVSLQYLDLSRNGKTTPMNINGLNIDGLQNLTKLITLNLSSNKLKQILAVFKLRSLKELNLSENELTDISPLKQLTNLSSLKVQGNKITDLSAIENHPNFDKYLTSLQQKPSPKLLKFSAKMKNLHQILEQQHQTVILNQSFKQNVEKQKERVQKLVSSSINNQVWFTGKIIILLKNFE